MPLTLEPLPAHDYAAWREEVVARRVAHPRLRGLGADTAAARAWAVVDRLLPVSGPPAGTEVLEVRADEESPRRVGTFFLLPAGPDRVELGDLVLDDPTDAAPLRHLLAERLAPRGIRTLGVGVLAGDPVHEALAADPAAELTATQMQLDLASARPATATVAVRVEPMGAEALAAYLDGAVEEFAGDLLTSDSSLSRSGRSRAPARCTRVCSRRGSTPPATTSSWHSHRRTGAASASPGCSTRSAPASSTTSWWRRPSAAAGWAAR